MKPSLLLIILLSLVKPVKAQIEKSNFVGLYYGYTIYAMNGSQGVKKYNEMIEVYNDPRQDTLRINFKSLSATYTNKLLPDSSLKSHLDPSIYGKFYSGGDSLYYRTFSPGAQGARTFEFYGHKTATGIEELFRNGVLLFPNPAKTSLSVNFPDYEGKIQYVVTELSGREVMSGEGANQLKLNVSSLLVGMYDIQTQLGNKVVHTRFVIE